MDSSDAQVGRISLYQTCRILVRQICKSDEQMYTRSVDLQMELSTKISLYTSFLVIKDLVMISILRYSNKDEVVSSLRNRCGICKKFSKVEYLLKKVLSWFLFLFFRYFFLSFSK